MTACYLAMPRPQFQIGVSKLIRGEGKLHLLEDALSRASMMESSR